MSDLKKKAIFIAAVAACFNANKNANELLATPDGNCFLPENKSFAEAHARRNNFNVEAVNREQFFKENETILAEMAAEKGTAKSETTNENGSTGDDANATKSDAKTSKGKK